MGGGGGAATTSLEVESAECPVCLGPLRVLKGGKPLLPAAALVSADAREGVAGNPEDDAQRAALPDDPPKSKKKSRKGKPLGGPHSNVDKDSGNSGQPGLIGEQAGLLPQTAAASASVPLPVVDSEGWQLFLFQGGLSQYVTWMNEGKMTLHDPIYITRCGMTAPTSRIVWISLWLCGRFHTLYLIEGMMCSLAASLERISAPHLPLTLQVLRGHLSGGLPPVVLRLFLGLAGGLRQQHPHHRRGDAH